MLKRSLQAGLWILAVGSTAVFAFLCSRRLVHPGELDAVEGVMMDHVVRLAHGLPIYVEPGLEFIPLASMPAFAALASLPARIFGPALWEPRVVSLLSILVIATLVYRIVVTETGGRTLGAAAVGVLMAAHGIVGGGYDVGRPDSLMLALALGGLASLRFTTGFLGALAAALLLTLAFFTQQHAVGFVLAALTHLAVNDRRRLLAFGFAVALGCGGGYALLASWLGPWFTFFTWDVPLHRPHLEQVGALVDLGRGLAGTLGALAIPTLLSLALPRPAWRGPPGIWVWAGCGALGAALMAQPAAAAARHVLHPVVVVLAVLGPISLARLVHHLAAWPGSERLGRSATIYLVLGLQFAPLMQGLRGQLPPANARAARAELVRMLREYPGPVIVLQHGHYGWSAGKSTSLQQDALEDILGSKGNRLLARDPRFFDRMFDRLRTGRDRPMIVADTALERCGNQSRALWSSLAASYVLRQELGWVGRPLGPIYGRHGTPARVYVPRTDVPGGRPAAGYPPQAGRATLSARLTLPHSAGGSPGSP
jgi:hypothetical protein